MNYEQRMMQIKAILSQILMTYELTRGMKDNEAAQMAEIDTIAKAINHKFPNDTNKDHIAGTMERVEIWLKGNYNKRTWPTGKDFINALGKSMQSVDAANASANSGIFTDNQIDIWKLNAKRIHAGERVGENWINGRGAKELLEKGLVTPQDLTPYKQTLRFLATGNPH